MYSKTIQQSCQSKKTIHLISPIKINPHVEQGDSKKKKKNEILVILKITLLNKKKRTAYNLIQI